MIKKIVLGMFFCLICPPVFAYIFTVSPTDLSQQYLGLIFGSTVGAINLVASSNNITLSLMFQNFNFIIVTIGAVVLGYLAVVSTINTAREGKALGEKISMWVPLRALFGMLMMVPGPASGYSIVQMTVLWIVLNGIGAANSVWNVVVTQLSQGIAIQGVTPPPNALPDGLVKAALNSSTCMHAINNMTDLLQGPGPLTQYGPITVYAVPGPVPSQPSAVGGNQNHLTLSQSASIYVGLQGQGVPAGLQNLCGEYDFTITLDNTVTSSTFNFATLAQMVAVKMQAIQAIFNVLDPAAQVLASNLSGTQYAPPDPGYIYAGGQAYLGQLTPILVGVQVASGPNAASWATNPVGANQLSSTYQELRRVGWIHAGSFYYTMVGASTTTIDPSAIQAPALSNVPASMATFDAAHPPAAWTTQSGTTTNSLPSLLDGNHLVTLNTALARASSYASSESTSSPNAQLSPTPISTGNGMLDSLVQGIANSIQNPILTGVENMMSGTSNDPNNYQPLTFTKDPLISMAQFGSGLMWAAEIATLMTILTSLILTISGAWMSCMSSLPFAILALLGQLTPLILGGFGLMWTSGATLGVYVPLIPYLIFTTSGFGWMVAVVEAMVGAPLIALGLVHPSGEELGKAESALVILANVFLRPTLMIFGFVIGASLLRAGLAFINYGFIPALTSSTLPSMMSIMAILGLYTMLIVSIVSKSFSLIYLLPNQIMRWMGGQAESSDPSDMVKEAKGGFDEGAKKGQEINDQASKSLRDKGSQAADKRRSNQENEGKEKQGGGSKGGQGKSSGGGGSGGGGGGGGGGE